ncbi:hypothetical protein KFL_002390190 [Klebsormidium nitens]|uniref:Reverse transcriptase Ty1/copia-type domain-containing protein n=1 Tax=Klebsormidium nitens TaxID=105231 RepID=A0A1Y1IBR3_KLENI|nr:hypothetical protein KFL_002390190 [Klebsormidium nitens]|eukprot:GAQ85528.1 hypothetical protein KFL_002390190 [Klebsormidium nitens]
MSAAQALKEALWFPKLGGDLELDLGTVLIYCDNQGAIWLLKHPIASQRSKHIDVIHHFARERVARKEVAFAYCGTEDMKADIMTNAQSASTVGEVATIPSGWFHGEHRFESIAHHPSCGKEEDPANKPGKVASVRHLSGEVRQAGTHVASSQGWLDRRRGRGRGNGSGGSDRGRGA